MVLEAAATSRKSPQAIRRTVALAGGLLVLAIALLAPIASGQAPPCCKITGIDARNDLVSASVNATGQVFQFKPTSPAILNSLRVGEAVYANFKTGQVSVDGTTPCGTIVSLGPAKGPLTPTTPSKAPSPPPVPQPGTSPKTPGGSTPQIGSVAPPAGTSTACCGITSIDARARLAAAKVNSTGQSFEFSVPNSVPIQNLHAGQPVWANFRARKASLDGENACCDIVSLSNTPTGPTGQPSARSAPTSPGSPGGARPQEAAYRQIDPCTIASADSLKALLQAGIQGYFPIAVDNGGEHIRITHPNVEQVICPHMIIKVHTDFGYSQTQGFPQFQTGGTMELQSSLVVNVTFSGGVVAAATAPITAANFVRAVAVLSNPQVTAVQIDNVPSWVDTTFVADCLNGKYSNWGCTDVLHAMSFDVTDLVRLYLQQGNTLPASSQTAAPALGQSPIMAAGMGKPTPSASPSSPAHQSASAAASAPEAHPGSGRVFSPPAATFGGFWVLLGRVISLAPDQLNIRTLIRSTQKSSRGTAETVVYQEGPTVTLSVKMAEQATPNKLTSTPFRETPAARGVGTQSQAGQNRATRGEIRATPNEIMMEPPKPPQLGQMVWVNRTTRQVRWVNFPFSMKQEDDLGDSHHLRTQITVSLPSSSGAEGQVKGETEVWTHKAFGGFKGSVRVTFVDDGNNALYSVHKGGGDDWHVVGEAEATVGTGSSDITKDWEGYVPADLLLRTAKVSIQHGAEDTLWHDLWNDTLGLCELVPCSTSGCPAVQAGPPTTSTQPPDPCGSEPGGNQTGNMSSGQGGLTAQSATSGPSGTMPPPAPQPGSSLKPAGSGTPQAALVPPTSGTSPACCGITSVDARARLAATKVNSTGQNFEFSVPNSVPVQNLHAGQPVWANFKARKVSLDGKTTCCDIVSFGSSPSRAAQAAGVPVPNAAQRGSPATAGEPKAQSALAAPGGSAAGLKRVGPIVNRPASPQIQNFGVFPGPIPGGQEDVGQVVLTDVPANGITVQLSSNLPSVASVPPQVQVPGSGPSAGAAVIVVKTSPVSRPTDVTLSAQVLGSSQVSTTKLTVRPPTPSILQCSPSTLISGTPIACKVWLDGPASAPGSVVRGAKAGADTSLASLTSAATPNLLMQIQISTNNSQVASVPGGAISVPAGATSVEFQVPTSAYPEPVDVIISASNQGSTPMSASVKLTAAAIRSFGCALEPFWDIDQYHVPVSTSCETVGGGGFHYAAIAMTFSGPTPTGFVKVSSDTAGVTFGNNAAQSVALPFQTGATWAAYFLVVNPVSVPTTATLSALDPLSNLVKNVQLKIDPPTPDYIIFRAQDSATVLTSIGNVLAGGQQVQTEVYLTDFPPDGGVTFDVKYSASDAAGNPLQGAISGPQQIKITGSYISSFYPTVQPCEVNAPCKVTVSIGSATATLYVNP